MSDFGVGLVASVQNHESSLAFVDIFTDGTSLLGVVDTGQSNEIILDLEGSTKRHSISNNGFGLLLSEIKHNTNKSCTEPRKNTCLIYYHLQILLLCWHLLSIVPMDIPVLSEVNIEHFLLINILKLLFFVSIFDVFV
mgnify:CR=1 FL=1